MSDSRGRLEGLARMRDAMGREAHGGSLQTATYDFPAETIEENADELNYWTEHIRRRLAAVEQYPGRMEMTALIMARESIYHTFELIELALQYQKEGR